MNEVTFMNMNQILNGKVMLVTGGAKGIGAEICKTAAECGADIAIHYNTSDEKAKALQQKIENEYGRRCIIVKGDISKEEDIDSIMNEVLKAFGTIDILVNNAAKTYNALMLMTTTSDWNDIINTNLRSVFLFSKKFVKYCIRKKKSGNVVNISSCAGKGGNVGLGLYGATKAGVNSLTQTFAKEYAEYNIRFNAIAPGNVDTDMMSTVPSKLLPNIINNVPMKRVALPEEIAKTVAFIASDLSSYTTGAVIAVDGGLTA